MAKQQGICWGGYPCSSMFEEMEHGGRQHAHVAQEAQVGEAKLGQCV